MMVTVGLPAAVSENDPLALERGFSVKIPAQGQSSHHVGMGFLQIFTRLKTEMMTREERFHPTSGPVASFASQLFIINMIN
jgi:hypothetical protein